MKIIIEKSSNKVFYLFPDNQSLNLTDNFLEIDSSIALDIKKETHSIIENVQPPPLWVGSGALSYSNSEWSWTEPGNISIDQRKEDMISRVNQILDQKRTVSFEYNFPEPYNTLKLQTRDSDLTNWLSVAQTAANLVNSGNPDVIYDTIRTEENVNVELTASEALAVMTALQEHLSSIIKNSWVLKDSIRSATTHSQLDLIDLNSGWS